MADRNTVFLLDDVEEDDLGGFNDPIFPSEAEEDPEKKEDPKEPEADKKKPEEDTPGEPEENPAKDAGPDDKKKESPDPDKDDQNKAPAVDFNKAIAMIAKQNEQINTLVATNQQLQKKVIDPDPEPEPLTPPEKPTFTQEQWDDDPESCSNAMYDYRESLKEHEGQVVAQEEEKQNKVNAGHMQKAVNESWELSTDVMPELAEKDESGNWKYPKARQAWEVIYRSPDLGLANDPNGPLKATRALRNHMKENDLSFDGQPKPPRSNPKPDPAEAAARGAEDEAARQKRVKAGTMHTGGKGGGQKSVQLSDEQKRVCKQMNISEKAYAESMSALGGE